MPDDTYIPDQTFTFDGTHYWEGQPMPMEVAKEHGLVEEDTDEDESPSEPESGAEEEAESEEEGEGSPEMTGLTLPPNFPKRADLIDAGYETVGAVVEAGADLEEIHGIGEATREDIVDAANELIS